MRWPQAPRVALVKLGALGDVIYAFPIVSALNAWRPEGRITWIIEERWRELPSLHPAVHDVVAVDTKAWRRAIRSGRWGDAWRGVRDFARSVAGRFDLVLDAQGLYKSGMAAWLTRSPVRIGFAPEDCRERGSARLCTRHAPPAGPVHVVQRNLGLLSVLGATPKEPQFDIRPASTDEAWASGWLAGVGIGPGDRVIALHPGAGHPAKKWGLERFASLARHLLPRTAGRVAFVTGPEDRAALDRVVEGLTPRVVIASPPTVGALAALLRRCLVVIAGDTGPLHLAAALGRPTVALYGPSDPVTAAPVGTGHRVLKHPCPCGWVPGPYFNRRCPDTPCMAAIGIDEVVEAVGSILASGDPNVDAGRLVKET